MKNSKTLMRKMRDEEFLRVYRDVVKEMMHQPGMFVRREAIRRAIKAGRPQYYLSYNRTYTVMLHYVKHGEVPLKSPEQRAMWLEIANAVMRQMEKRRYLSLPQAVARTLATARASRFFISEAYAYKLLYRIMNEKKKNV